MFGFFKSKPQEETPQRTSNGFFSTDFIPAKKPRSLANYLSLSFQKSADNFIPLDANGVAMDSIYSPDMNNLQSVKLMNNSNFYQMVPEAQIAWYSSQGFMGYQVLAMMAQNWLIEKACIMPAKDATRNGYDITVTDDISDDILDDLKKYDKSYGVKNQLVDAVKFNRVFGIRVVLFKVESDDEDYYAKPFNPDGVTPGSYKGIVQIDPYWITPELDQVGATDPSSFNFYNPTWWRINGKRYHVSHLVVLTNSKVADILKPSYLYGGVSIPQKIAERVFAAERTANEAPMLAMTKRLTVLKTDTSKAFANFELFTEKLLQWNQLMNNYGIKAIGEDEEITQFDTGLADLDAAIMTQFQIVAAASEIPATKLLGTSPKGFGASGEYEESSYHEFLSSIQEHDLTPILDRHHLLIIRSELCPKYGIKPFETEVVWNEIDEMSAEQQADVNLKKAQAAAQYVEIGAIDGVDVRETLIADKESGYNSLEDKVIDMPDDTDGSEKD